MRSAMNVATNRLATAQGQVRSVVVAAMRTTKYWQHSIKHDAPLPCIEPGPQPTSELGS